MRIGRWIKRGVLVLLGLIVVAIVAVVIIVHTSFGREIVRSQIESQLNGMFVGGGSVGKVDGSPFTKLVLTDVVINGPDGQPAISVKKLTIGLALTALVSKHVNLTSVNVDGLDVRLARNQDGSLQMENLLKPQPSSGWSVNIPDLQIHHGHVLYDTGTEWMNADAAAAPTRSLLCTISSAPRAPLETSMRSSSPIPPESSSPARARGPSAKSSRPMRRSSPTANGRR